MLAFFAETSGSAGRSRGMLLGVAAFALLVVAVIAWTRRDKPDDTGQAQATETLYICLSDDNTFTLTPAQYAAQAAAAPASPDTMRGQVPKVRCTKCNQYTAVRAARCAKDQTVVPTVSKDGGPPHCPKCGANPFG